METDPRQQGEWFVETATQQLSSPGSSIIDMEHIDMDDFEMDDTDSQQQQQLPFLQAEQSVRGSEGPGLSPSLTSQLGVTMADQMWTAGKEQAQKAFTLYGNVDVLRPYFDVEPNVVLNRLLFSFVPQRPSTQQKVSSEMYGPTMIVFTLVAVLLFGMKTSNHVLQEGTLMGTAIGTCFGYWGGISCIVFVVGVICNAHLTLGQIFHLIGYSLFSHCVVIFLSAVIHSNSHMFFYLLWLVFGGMSALKIISVFVSRTPGRSQKLILCALVVAANLLFMIYLHFAYHKVVIEIEQVFENEVVMMAAIEKDIFDPQDGDEHPLEENLQEAIGEVLGRVVEAAVE